MKGVILVLLAFWIMSQSNGQDVKIDCNWDTLTAKRIEIITLPTNIDCSRLSIKKKLAFIPAPEELNYVLIKKSTYESAISSRGFSQICWSRRSSIRCRYGKDKSIKIFA